MAASVLDVTSSGKSIWHDERKNDENVIYSDIRRMEKGSSEYEPWWSINPDILADVRQLPFADGAFDLVCFDPPHRITEGGMSQLSGAIEIKYGSLHAETWQRDLREAVNECWRVLRPGGTLTLKWADVHKNSEQVLDQLDQTPLYGTVDQNRNDRAGTKWWVFHKSRAEA